MFCTSFFSHRYFSHNCRTCPKSPILNKPKFMIGASQLLWSRHVNFFCLIWLFITCSFLSPSSIKGLLSNLLGNKYGGFLILYKSYCLISIQNLKLPRLCTMDPHAVQLPLFFLSFPEIPHPKFQEYIELCLHCKFTGR